MLTGGAKLVTTTLADGSVGTVLDLSAGATAVSPQMCVDSQYPDARAQLRMLGNGPALHAYVAYTGAKSGGQSSGALTGSSTWGVSHDFQLHAGSLVGWQQAQYTFVGDKGEAQLYDFYVDPHCFW